MNIIFYCLSIVSVCIIYYPKAYPRTDANNTLINSKERAIYREKLRTIGDAIFKYQQSLRGNAPVYFYNSYFSLLFDIELFKCIIHILDEQKDRLDAIIKDNLELELIVAQALLYCNRQEEAMVRLLELNDKFPDNDNIPYYLITAYLNNNNLSEAKKLIENCIANPALRSRYSLFYFLQSKIFLQEENVIAAFEAIDQSVALLAKPEEAWLLRDQALQDTLSDFLQFCSQKESL